MAFPLLVAIVVWFCHELVWGGKVPFFRDLGIFFYPLRLSLAESFKAAELPLWNRHLSMGFPLLADFQSGTFYLPHLFYLILPFFAAVTAIFLFHYLVAATGSYMLCRHWRFPPYLSLIGAMLFTLGGAIVSLSNLMDHFQTAVWLPWALFLGERALRRLSWKNFVALTLVLSLQFLAGSPEMYGMGLGLLLLDGLRLNAEEANISCRKIFFLLLGANLLVAGVAMVQILPTLELFLESRGGHPITYVESVLWSLHPLSLINLFFLDKEVDTNIGSGLRLFFANDIPFLVSHYMGAISLFGIALWFSYASRKERILLLGFTIISLVIAMGGHTLVYPLLFRYVPFFSFSRYPEKFFVLSYAFLLFIALRGLYDFLERGRPVSRGAVFVLSLMLIPLLLVYCFLRFDIESLIRFILWATGSPSVFLSTLKGSSGVLVSLERQLALAFGILFLLLLWKKGKVRPFLFKSLMVGLVFVDLTSAHQPYQYLLNPDFVYKGPRIIQTSNPEPQRLFYYPGPYLHPSYFTILKEPSFPEFQALTYSNLLPNTGVFHGMDYMQEMAALRRWPYVVFVGVASKLPPEKLYRLLGALNVKYVVSFKELPHGLPLVQHFPEYPSWLYRIDRVIPRVYIVPKVIVEQGLENNLDRLSSAEFDPFRQVILEKPLSISVKKDFQAEAKILRYMNNQVTVQASLNGSGVLVLADSFYPGWQVYVDGKEKEILRANFFFRAVPLSAGEHVVEFRYQPRSFMMGLYISLAFLAAVSIWSVFLFVRKT